MREFMSRYDFLVAPVSQVPPFPIETEWIDEIDYSVDPARSDSFYGAIRRYWPDLPDNSLSPDYCGIRPKLSKGGKHADDFQIDGAVTHGLPGYVGLYGIESPGLTSSIALGDLVRDVLNDDMRRNSV